MPKLTPMRAIRAKCLDCSAGSAHEVRLCPVETCALYTYRMGKNPALAGRKGNTEALEAYRRAKEAEGGKG